MKSRFITISLLVLILIIIFIPYKFNYNIELKAQIMPLQQWIVAKSTNGTIISCLNDNYSGITSSLNLISPDRGDRVSFELSNNIGENDWIPKNYQIGLVTSNEWSKELAELNGELNISRTNLINLKSGEKQPVIKELELQLDYYSSVGRQQAIILDRTKTLFENNLISTENFEIESSRFELDNINISIAKAQLEIAKTGAKPELYAVETAKIEALQSIIETLKVRSEGMSILTPISGVKYNSLSPDTLFQIMDNSQVVAVIPLSLVEFSILREYEQFDIEVSGGINSYNVNEYRFDKTIRTIANRQVMLLFCKFENTDMSLISGMVVNCTIKCDPEKPVTHLLRYLK
ncbi:MAG: hypothetical protein HOF29_10915 [Candidatus Marinimicrobia bacterium]|jgi:hypothetical protein|nr:hypothetical protein [Candidatus Neomarinimicrobiota bacterium]MBT3896571.1 hypothetical protein [Candidatus Neomarinimicrobiota bacterium]MBT6217144.1 hypothetical protein [Candidatus Neomarinimicrobiota bacterium]